MSLPVSARVVEAVGGRAAFVDLVLSGSVDVRDAVPDLDPADIATVTRARAAVASGGAVVPPTAPPSSASPTTPAA